MTEHDPGHDAARDPAPARHAAADGEDVFARPPGAESGFAPREEAAAYSPPPPTVSPAEQAVFARPASGEPFAPGPNERIPPRHSTPPPVPAALTEAFSAPAGSTGSFAPPEGTRLTAGPRRESPWWKADAARDPWRDPSSPYWLGRGAVFPGGRPEQLAPDADVEQDPSALAAEEDEQTPGEPEATGRYRFGLRSVLVLLVLGLLVGGIGGGVGYVIAHRSDNLLHRSDVNLSTSSGSINRPPGSISDIAKRVGPAVVSISVTTSSAYAVGSGVVVDKHGYVLTNNHVVADAAGGKGSIVVTFADEATAKASIVGLDPVSDLAVLKVPTTELTVAALGDSSKLAVGDPVIAIGSPLALQGTVTEGIVSALDRAVHIQDDQGGSDVYLDAIQTDAAINHGNSGGALVDGTGAVVGINSAAALDTPGANGQSSSVTGIGFAIPINYARGIADQLIHNGKAVHAALGAQGRTATANDGLQNGAYLEQVVEGGAAAKAGLRPGDVVVAAGGRSTPSYDQLVVVVQNHKPGDTVDVTYYRGTQKRTTRVTLGSD